MFKTDRDRSSALTTFDTMRRDVMLFSSCSCMTRPSFPTRRTLSCAGGVGFVSALVGTMIGSGQTAQAEKVEGLTVERAGPNEIPDAPPRSTLVGEWGLSMHAESHRGNE